MQPKALFVNVSWAWGMGIEVLNFLKILGLHTKRSRGRFKGILGMVWNYFLKLVMVACGAKAFQDEDAHSS
jgi:hypothetical protein